MRKRRKYTPKAAAEDTEWWGEHVEKFAELGYLDYAGPPENFAFCLGFASLQKRHKSAAYYWMLKLESNLREKVDATYVADLNM